MFCQNKRRRIDFFENNKKRKNESNHGFSKRIRYYYLNIDLDHFKETYTEFIYDLSNGICLRKINVDIFKKYIEASCNLSNLNNFVKNSKYLSKYDKDIDMDNNFIISEEDLWNFFEYELNEIN